MSTSATPTTINASITVDAPIETAFDVFTADLDSWFPAEYNLLDTPIVKRVFEPHVGGEIYDIAEDGKECHWARVLAYEPPDRVVFSWDIGTTWQIETDKDKTSEVEVRFIADGPDRTRVELEHRHLDRHGDGWEAVRESTSGDGGWTGLLTRFAERIAA
jgi:uncharacterized protein YndB with AHSA1/START domain